MGPTMAMIVFFTIIILVIICCLYFIFRSPFHYPYFVYSIDISGKRNPHFDDLIDVFIIEGGFPLVQQHIERLNAWNDQCRRKIDKSILKSYRIKQFQKCLDYNNAFQFKFTRMQTRYRQTNYVKNAYKVSQVVNIYTCNYAYLLERKNLLEAISYERPLRQYYSKNQRNLMTKELRNAVILRDNYTCQICGKYMPDEVGLQIDHIMPVSKGGKTVLSNLQVTCSKCNARKKDKIYYY